MQFMFRVGVFAWLVFVLQPVSAFAGGREDLDPYLMESVLHEFRIPSAEPKSDHARLVHMLSDPDPRIRVNAACAVMWVMESTRAAQILVPALVSEGHPQVAEALVRLLAGGTTDTRLPGLPPLRKPAEAPSLVQTIPLHVEELWPDDEKAKAEGRHKWAKYLDWVLRTSAEDVGLPGRNAYRWKPSTSTWIRWVATPAGVTDLVIVGVEMPHEDYKMYETGWSIVLETGGSERRCLNRPPEGGVEVAYRPPPIAVPSGTANRPQLILESGLSRNYATTWRTFLLWTGVGYEKRYRYTQSERHSGAAGHYHAVMEETFGRTPEGKLVMRMLRRISGIASTTGQDGPPNAALPLLGDDLESALGDLESAALVELESPSPCERPLPVVMERKAMLADQRLRGGVGDPDDWQKLTDALGSPHRWVRRWAAERFTAYLAGNSPPLFPSWLTERVRLVHAK